MIRLEGVGLHGGRRCALVFSQTEGETTFGHDGARASLRALDIEGRDRTTVARFTNGAEVRSIEHLCAAITGLRAFEGVHVEIEGDEAPLLDGASRAIVDVLAPIVRPSRRAARVVAERTFVVDGATHRFLPREGTHVEISVNFPAERFGRPLEGSARWDGDGESFVESIAPARTFGAARELEALRARGLAGHVPEGAVVAIDVDDPKRAPRDADEPIRHKLLDLLGDLATLGAPLRGALVVHRPSHRSSHRALARALDEGVIVVERV